MKQYGGGYQHYYSRSKCTHIIATNLPDSKIKELRLVVMIVLVLSVFLCVTLFQLSRIQSAGTGAGGASCSHRVYI